MAGGEIELEGKNEEGKYEVVVEQDFSSFNARTSYQIAPADTQIKDLPGNGNVASGQGSMAGVKIKGKVKQTF
jgi:hypothetical protein